MEVDPHKVDEDAPQISTLPSETPPPVQRRVKLLVNRPPSVASQPSSVASTSRKRPISALSDEDDEQIDELIDDDAPMPTAPVRHPASVPIPAAASSEPPAKKKAPAKRKPRKTEKKQAEEERIAAEKVMQQQHTTGGPPPSMTWFEVSPNKGQPGQQQQPQQQLQQLQQQGAGGQMGTIDLSVKELKIVPLDPGPSAAPPQKKEKAPRKTPAATRGRAKPGPKPKQALLLPIPASDDMLEVASEAGFSVTAASSPITTHFDANTPEPEAAPVPTNGNGNGTIAEEPMTINLQDIPLPQYPLPLKPFSVQPPAKISSSGSAQPAPLDRSGAKVRQWRVVNREIRGIAGGRWFTKTWIGAKESVYAQVLEKQAAAVVLPKVPSIPTGGTPNKPGPKPKAKNANAAASSSKAPSAVPSRSSSAVPTKMRTVVAAPSSDAGDSRNVTASPDSDHHHRPRGHAVPARARRMSGLDGAGTSLKQWVAERSTERAAAQQAFATDPKYKKYTQQVERCLNSFDNVQEWADCIAFLKQLLKTFQSYMQFKEIPRKLIVAKRLSQCLNPALPTGVHQRALDVYSHILAVLGSEGLKRDLALWSSGLFPFFEYAATSVKPALLNLYDTHYLPLQASLRPIMKSFIIALLPGLEEETGEFFDKAGAFLYRRFRNAHLSPAFFFQNIWLVMLTTPSARGNALNLLGRRLPRLNAEEDITVIIGQDIGLMIRAFAAALEDDNLLVRRGALDLLLQSMRVDSIAVRQAQADDRAILMRAATSVVLRRDLSLNRRLYTWLLGPDEGSERQVAYFREHALVLLRSTLKEEMSSPSGDYAESRPFKIFISLLDKWEIGAALTESLVFDAFKAIKRLVGTANGGEDVTMTASTLYEAVEPAVLWKQLLGAVFGEITGSGNDTEAIDMVLFVLRTFVQDEEVRTIHLPIIFASLVDLVDIQVQTSAAKALTPAVRSTLILLEAILQKMPPSALVQRPELTGDLETAAQTQRPYIFAATFYGCKPVHVTQELQGPFNVPFASAFQNLVSLSTSCSRFLTEGCSTPAPLREVLAQSLLLMDRLATRLETSVTLTWKPEEWLSSVLATLENENCNFTVVDRAISLIVALHATPTLAPRLLVDDRPTMYKMVTRLLKYLSPNLTVYHARSVNLIWSLEKATRRSHVESVLAQAMTSPESRNVQDAYEAFGVLWRLTEDSLLPGFRFKVPMMIVLDTLKNDDPALRRIGETWMRCSLKSYLRVLDPILFDLLDSGIRRQPTVVKVKGKELQGFVYERPFDQRYVNHLLDMLLSIIRFGGQGFAKTARGTSIKRSHHAGLVHRVDSAGMPDPDASYLEVLVEILLRFIQSEPKPASESVMEPNNLTIQSTAIDLLQAIVARGEIDHVTVETIEAIVVGKLFSSIHRTRLDLQNKLLHLLHSLISASVVANDAAKQHPELALNATSPDSSQDASSRPTAVNPLLIQTLVDGISAPSNRPVLQHWLDFVLMAVPQFQPALQAAVTPLNECICKQLLASLGDVLHVTFEDGLFTDDLKSSTTDAELIMLLGGLERLVLLSLAYPTEPSSSDEDQTLPEKSTEGGGLLGYVSTVFSSDTTPANTDDQLTAKSPGYRSLHEGVRVLYLVWSTLSWSDRELWSSKDETLSMIYNRTRLRCRRVLEHLFRMQSAEVFESIIDCWNRELPESQVPYEQAFELVDVLIASAQSAVHMICESITCRVSGISEKSKKQAINPDLTEAVLFKFLEQYLQRLEGPLALQVWGRYLQLVKDLTGSAREFKPQTYPALRCLAVLADKITQTTAMEDRRIRKELQETYGKLLDSCVVFVGRAYDQGSWIRRSTKDPMANGRESPAPQARDEKLASSVSSLGDPRPASFELATQINQFIATTAMPNLRKFLMDNDKVVASCTNIVYYIISPAMKGKSSKPMDVDPAVLSMIEEMTKIPSTLKTWRPPVVELLNDNRLFNCNPESADKWKPIMKSLFDLDKAAFPELLAKVATAPSANIFTNREYEMLLRSLNVRRLSYILFAGEKNFFLTLLPSIQEKLVEILRNVTAPIVQSEVYLCIRVLLCRLSAHNLTSFWPVLLTELYRIFEQLITAPLPADGSEDLQLILSASKCLDLLLALQSEEFQIHQWIFITDTVDAIYRPDDCFPEAMMDHIAEIVGSLPVAESRDPPAANGLVISPAPNVSMFGVDRPMRRPMLNSVRQMDSIRDLMPFFSSVSISSYESVYASGGNVDWAAVEKGLLEDMFDGR
ncbi:Dopey-N domain-containing protein [Mycena chlorophos]|uniref:Dopey-N domain-containing protein n=1 Tax=Mycena chlorophos TaxID=658473 RepID=A0A8H6SNP8_MYCCL|nr:Dopey-N domain-containing protein [Mycena chlorophos]